MAALLSIAVAGTAPGLVSAAPCQPKVAAPRTVVKGAKLTVRYTACATGAHRFRLISLGSNPALRGRVRARRTAVAAPGRRKVTWSVFVGTGAYALSMELPTGRRIRAPHAIRFRRAPPGPTGPLCGRGRTLIKSSESRIFTVGRTVFGCHGRQRRAWVVGSDGDDSGLRKFFDIGRVGLAGPWFVYGEESGGRAHTRFHAVRMDLRNGRKVRIEAGELGEEQRTFDQDVGRGPLTDLVVKPNGSLAFIYEDRREPGEHGVGFADLDGTRYVESAADIRPGTLTISGESQVTWTQGDGRSEALR